MRPYILALMLIVALPGAFLATATPGGPFDDLPFVGGSDGRNETGPDNGTGNETDDEWPVPPRGPHNETREHPRNDTGRDRGHNSTRGNGTGNEPRGHIAEKVYVAGVGGFSKPSTVRFNGTNTTETPVRISVKDAFAVHVAFLACQDVDGDGACGEAGEPRVEACDAADLAAVPFVQGHDTLVTVYLVSPLPCASTATTGIITLTFA